MRVAQGKRALHAGDWRPDARLSALIACGAAAALVAAFLALLCRPATGPRPALLTLSVIHGPPDRRPSPRARAPSVTPAMPMAHPLAPLPPVPGSILLQEQMDAAVRAGVAGGERALPFLMPPAQQYDELDRALQAPAKPGTLSEGEGYRSAYGGKVVKSGAGCTSLQEVQVGPVAKAGVGFMVSCAGERHPTMADALAEWASKRATLSPPP